MGNLMSWLGYVKHKSEFVFVYNKAEDMDEDVKVMNVGRMCSLIGADATHAVYMPVPERPGESIKVAYARTTGFPPGAPLETVRESIETLYNAIFLFRKDSARLEV